jgi:uncharacterized protein
MRIAVTGSSGLVGSDLLIALREGGHDVLRMVRAKPAGRGAAYWNPDTGEIDTTALAECGAVIHLAGANIGEKRWTEARKRDILESRTKGTGLIAETLAKLDGGPRTLVSMSGVHIYGDRGDEPLTEDAAPGSDLFMARVATAWEAATAPAEAAGIRVAHVRGAVSITPKGSTLARMLPLFRLGLGGRLGSGRQWWAWTSLDDMIGILIHAALDPDVRGPLNAVAPNPVTNAEFTRILAKVLGRPAVLPVPSFGPRLVFGDLADELIYASIRAIPERTLASGYTFIHADLESALRDLLGRRDAA